jgi:hypothetical protein
MLKCLYLVDAATIQMQAIGREATYVSPSSGFCGGCTLKSEDCTSHAADDMLPFVYSQGVQVYQSRCFVKLMVVLAF